MTIRDAHRGSEEQLQAGTGQLVSYFHSGARGRGDFLLGFELEHIIVGGEGNKNSAAIPFTGDRGVAAILERLAPLYEECTRVNPLNSGSPLLGLARADATITLEPGAQFEFSSAPVRTLSELNTIWQKFNREIRAVCDGFGYDICTIGYQPHSRVADIELLPKERYRIMDRYFARTGTRGINMMRGSAATQVAIDYADEADAVLKMRVAAALTPLLALLTDNSPVFEGARAQGHLTRTAIWNDVDPDRSMLPPGLFSDNYDFATYARTVLTAPLVVMVNPDGSVREVNRLSAADCYDLSHLSTADIEHILSMFFFDVRLRHYVEIRAADSLPFPYALGYVALLKGLFYDEQNLRELSACFADFSDATVPAIKAALIKDGYDAAVDAYYGECVQGALRDLLARARLGLDRLDAGEEAAYLDVFDWLVEGKTTLAQEYEG